MKAPLLVDAPPKRAWNSGEAEKGLGEPGQRLALLYGPDPEVEAALVGQAVQRRLVERGDLRCRVGGIEHQAPVGEAHLLDSCERVGLVAALHAQLAAGLRPHNGVPTAHA